MLYRRFIPTVMLLGLIFLGAGRAVADTPQRSVSGPGTSSGKLTGKLLITGSSTIAPMIVEIAKRFQTLHPDVQIEVQTGGSGRGISDAIEGKANLGMVSRALKDNESGLYSFAIGRDGICLIVHKDNPVQSLTNQQVVDIYTGKIASWKKVGGRDAPITVMNAGEGFGSVELFTQFYHLKYSDIKAQLLVGENPTRIKAITENPSGIMYISVGTAERAAAAGAPIRPLPVDGVAATRKNIMTGNFPISRPLLLLSKEVPTGLVKEFVSFSLSSQATGIIEKFDFVPYLD
jgi:phosphate transport system substrate-binding protein